MVSNGVKGVGGLSIRVQFIISFANEGPSQHTHAALFTYWESNMFCNGLA